MMARGAPAGASAEAGRGAPAAPAGLARPASVEQERHWLADQLRDRAAAPMLGVIAVSSGRIDADALEESFAGLAARYDALSTRVALVGDEGVVARGVRPPFARLTAAGDDGLAAVVRVQARARLDLGEGPVAMGMHVAMPAADAAVIVVHPAVCDHASLAVLADQLARGYAARTGATTPEPTATFSFLRQRPSVSEEESVLLEEGFRGCDLSAEFPYARPATAGGFAPVAAAKLELTERQRSMLALLAAEVGVEPTAVLVTAFQALLQQYAYTADIVVAVEVDRRPSPGAVGPFADLALVRSQHADASFRAAVHRTAALLERAVDEFPVRPTALARSLEVKLGVERPELTNAAVLRRTALPPLAVCDARWECRPIEDDITRFALALVDDDVHGPWFAYATDVLDESGAGAIARHLRTLLGHGLAVPDTPLSQLDPVDADEQAQLLELRRGRESAGSAPQLVHAHVERVAQLRPDAPAIVRGAHVLSYGELDARSNQLAHRLRALGAGGEAPVLVRLPRSPELLVAVLAIHKCGSAALVVDPLEPGERVSRILSYSTPSIAIAATPQPVVGETVLVDASWAAVANEPRTAPEISVDLDANAFLAVTSGSTARPKFVEVTHRSICHHAETWSGRHGVAAGDRGMWLAPLQTGIGVLEYARYLAVGASVRVVEAEIAASPAELRDWIVASRITHGFVVPQMADALQELEWPEDTALRMFLVGGDRVRHWAPADLPYEMSTGYGTTEAAQICDSSARSPRLTSKTVDSARRAERPPVGYPIEDAKVTMVDRNLKLVPPGVPGELCVAGPLLARGYLGEPAATAERFVPDPFADGGLMYRTGDLARWRPDGLVEHLGRIDMQIKIRGFRIDAGEVESTLLQHPSVQGAAVVAWRVDERETRLAAYVTGVGMIAVNLLRRFVADRLPGHMVPAKVVVLEQLPLLATGKVDRLALPEPDWSRPDGREEYVAPRDELEEAVVSAWRDVLGLDSISVHDDFFDLGGDSLSAGRIVAQLRKALGVELKLRDHFVAATPAGFAARVRKRREAGIVGNRPDI